MTENTMGSIAISDAAIDAVNEKAINCQSALKSLVDATSGITWPQAGILGCLVVSIAGVAGYGIYALCDLVKSGHPVELTSGGGALRGEYGSARRGEQPLIGGQENRCR